MVDAAELLALTADLRELRVVIDDAPVPATHRRRWQRTLAAIAQGATDDLGRASAQLARLRAQVERRQAA